MRRHNAMTRGRFEKPCALCLDAIHQLPEITRRSRSHSRALKGVDQVPVDPNIERRWRSLVYKQLPSLPSDASQSEKRPAEICTVAVSQRVHWGLHRMRPVLLHLMGSVNRVPKLQLRQTTPV